MDKKPFSDKRWHDNPFDKSEPYHGKPLTEEEKAENRVFLEAKIQEFENKRKLKNENKNK